MVAEHVCLVWFLSCVWSFVKATAEAIGVAVAAALAPFIEILIDGTGTRGKMTAYLCATDDAAEDALKRGGLAKQRHQRKDMFRGYDSVVESQMPKDVRCATVVECCPKI